MRMSATQVEEQILLGGKISNIHPEYKDIAQNTPSNQKAVYILKNWEKLLDKEPIEAVTEILKEFGKIDNFAQFGEITKLSAIVGDPRARHSGKKIKEALRKKQQGV